MNSHALMVEAISINCNRCTFHVWGPRVQKAEAYLLTPTDSLSATLSFVLYRKASTT